MEESSYFPTPLKNQKGVIPRGTSKDGLYLSFLKVSYQVVWAPGPVNDPLNITDFDDNILDVMQKSFKTEAVKIRHVAQVLMESYGDELFPLQQGSDCHQMIMKSHGDTDGDEIN